MMPTLPPAQPTEDLFPIDILYGFYDPITRVIEIYYNNIQRDASIFGAEGPDLLEVVRLHEYAHAVVHLGVRLSQVTDTLKAMGPDGYTDWKTFLERRRRAFEHLDSASHEFLAQAITFASLVGLTDTYRSERLRAIFEALETKQPAHYIVPTEIKARAQQVEWSLALEAARGDIDAFRASGFSMYAGLLALARDFTAASSEPLSTEREWVTELGYDVAIARLKSALSAASEQPDKRGEDHFEFLVDRFAGLRVEVFAREHPPPHFRVICGQDSANYRIADCKQLNGDLRREYRVIREWYAENRGKLIDAWNQRRPSDCPVGLYREA
jgi:hypothetical protein